MNNTKCPGATAKTENIRLCGSLKLKLFSSESNLYFYVSNNDYYITIWNIT